MQPPIFFTLVCVLLTFQGCFAPPVAKDKTAEKEEQKDGLEDYMEYHRYLREVVNALESDPEFRQKLEKAEETDIRSGKIAHELEFVSHHVRTRLDEIKRMELERLRELMEKKQKLENLTEDVEEPNHHHLDHSNPHTFEIEDLKRLIAKTTEDLAEADRKRREEFKEYEMQKEFEKQAKLNQTTGEEKEKLEKELKEQEEKHKKHEPLHEPGHKKQLEEVWEEQDHMQQEFDPKTFFMLHDLDSNGLWDQDEVKALFVKELDKMYSAGAPEDDMRERVEEMERMRETVFREVDVNRDGFIDYQEFLAQTRRNDFQQDHGWQGLDEQKPYTDQELQEYIRQQQTYYPHGYPPPHHGGMGYPQHPGQMPHQGYHPQQGFGQPQQHQQGFNQQQQHQQGFGQQHQQGFGQQHQQGFGQQPAVDSHPNQPPHTQFNTGNGQQHGNINNAAHVPDLNTNEIYQSGPGNQGHQFNQNQQHPNQPGGLPHQPNQQFNQNYQQQQHQQQPHQQQQLNQPNNLQQGTGQINKPAQFNHPSNVPGQGNNPQLNHPGNVPRGNPQQNFNQNQFQQNPNQFQQPNQVNPGQQNPHQFQQNNLGHVPQGHLPPVQQNPKSQEVHANKVQGSPQINQV